MGALRLVALLCVLGAALGATLTDSEAAQEHGLLKWEGKELPKVGTGFDNIESQDHLHSEVEAEESSTGLLEEPEHRRPRPRARNGKRRRRMRRPRTKRPRTTPPSEEGNPELDLAEGRLAHLQYEEIPRQGEDRPRLDQDEEVVYQRRRPAKRRRRPHRRPHEFTDPSRFEDIPATRETIHETTLTTEHETPSENQFEQRLLPQKGIEVEIVTQNKEAETTTATPRRRRKGGRKRIRIDGEWKAVEMPDVRLDEQSTLAVVKQESSTNSQISPFPLTDTTEVLSHETFEIMTTPPNGPIQHNPLKSEKHDEPSSLPLNHATEPNTSVEGTNSNVPRVKEQAQPTLSEVQITDQNITPVDQSTNNGQNFGPTSGTQTEVQYASEISSKEAMTQVQKKLYDPTIQIPSKEYHNSDYHKPETTKIAGEETTFSTSTNADGNGAPDSNSTNGYTQNIEMETSAPVSDKPSGQMTYYSLFPSFSVREVTQLSDYKTKNKDSDESHPGSTSNDDNTIQGRKVHKNSYSVSHSLPTTAAAIRRQLRPKLQLNATNSEKDDAILLTMHHNHKKKQITSINTTKNDVNHSLLLPTGFPEQPEIISPSKIIEEAKMEEMLKLEIERIAKKGNKTQVYNTPLRNDNLKFEALGIPNVNDDILDLLKTETGYERLARILEIRNMSLVELIKHRERGSSQLHLMEIFGKNTESKQRETLNDGLKLTGDERNLTPVSEPTNLSIIQFSDKELGQIPTLKFFLQKQNTQRTSISSSTSTTPKTTSSSPISNGKREPRVFDSMPQFPAKLEPRIHPVRHQMYDNRPPYAGVPFKGISKELALTTTTSTVSPKRFYDINDVVLLEGYDKTNLRNNLKGGKISTESGRAKDFRALPTGVKSAIIASGAILSLAIVGFFALLVSCRIRQRRARIRIKRDILCDHLHYEDFRSSQRSLTPVLRKSSHNFGSGIHSNTASNRHYYLWRTLRKTFQYD